MNNRKNDVEKALRALSRRNIKTLSTDERAIMKRLDEELTTLKRIERSEYDVAYFAYEYFSDDMNHDNDAGNLIPAGETLDNIATIHRSMYDLADDITTKVSGKYAILAPRGHAKTTILSTIVTLHEIVFKKRKYALILSETDVLSKRILASISSQLKYNQKLRNDYGELLDKIATKNEKDNEESFITTSGQLVEASSSGKAIRGKTHRGSRPDLIIADDLSSMNNEATQQQRQKLIDWWNTSVTPLGSSTCATIIVGTRVTATGLIATLMENREYKRVSYSAIISEPASRTKWGEYCHLYASNATDDELERFYDDNKDELEEGVELAWPRRWTYRALMHEKMSIGPRAFASEYLNESFAADEQFFKTDDYGYCRRVFDYEMHADAVEYEGEFYYIRDMQVVVAYDPALGRSRSADANAAVFLGKHKRANKIFLLESYAKVCKPSEFIDDLMQIMTKYRHVDKLVFEAIGAYELIGMDIRENLRAYDLYSTRFIEIKSHGKQSKKTRIETLEAPLSRKELVLNEREAELLSELKYFPSTSSKDDLIDAMTMAYRELGINYTREAVPKPAWAY